jgi:creatinine amidohydrolase
LLPVSIIEAHGTHLPLATDILETTGTCVLIKQNLAKLGVEAVITPPYYLGNAGGYHTGEPPGATNLFPGTISTSPKRMSENILDIIASFGKAGFKKFFIFNHHGGLGQQEGIYGAITGAPNVKNPLTNEPFSPPLEVYWVDPISPNWDVTKGLRDKYGLTLKEPFWLNWREFIPTMFYKSNPPRDHAEEIETSAMMYFFPDLVDIDAWRRLPQGTRAFSKPPWGDMAGLIAKRDLAAARAMVPEMIVGDCTAASPEFGKYYWELTAQQITQAIYRKVK